MKGVTVIRGDFGNPKGGGYGKITIDNLESVDAATALTDMDTFVDALKTNAFTAANVGKTSVTIEALQSADKPGADVSVDDQLIVDFEKSSEGKRRTLTISGCLETSAVHEPTPAGRRITAAAATILEGLLDTLFGWTGEASVRDGKWISKR